MDSLKEKDILSSAKMEFWKAGVFDPKDQKFQEIVRYIKKGVTSDSVWQSPSLSCPQAQPPPPPPPTPLHSSNAQRSNDNRPVLYQPSAFAQTQIDPKRPTFFELFKPGNFGSK
jgi:hypothetical protein